MCVIALGTLAASGGATGGALGTGATAGGLFGTSFLESLGLTTPMVNALFAETLFKGTRTAIDTRRLNRQAQFEATQAVKEAQAADSALARDQEAVAARLKEDRKANAQEQIALAKKGAQAAGALRASERAGLTIDMLLGDVERQTGEASNLLNQTLASTVQQYRRKTLGLDAERKNRRNIAESKYNAAKGKTRGNLDVALSTLGSGISNYYGLVGQA
tara:strand:- start:3176 stop:3829 length:654 start_codon:yes stop_codon:yes gene_type:complete